MRANYSGLLPDGISSRGYCTPMLLEGQFWCRLLDREELRSFRLGETDIGFPPALGNRDRLDQGELV